MCVESVDRRVGKIRRRPTKDEKPGCDHLLLAREKECEITSGETETRESDRREKGESPTR